MPIGKQMKAVTKQLAIVLPLGKVMEAVAKQLAILLPARQVKKQIKKKSTLVWTIWYIYVSECRYDDMRVYIQSRTSSEAIIQYYIDMSDYCISRTCHTHTTRTGDSVSNV